MKLLRAAVAALFLSALLVPTASAAPSRPSALSVRPRAFASSVWKSGSRRRSAGLESAASAAALRRRTVIAWGAPAVPGELVLTVAQGTSVTAVAARVRAAGYGVKSVLISGRALVVSVPRRTSLYSAASKLRKLRGVSTAEANYKLHLDAGPNDARISQQWGLDAIGAETAWTKSTGAGATIAVVDTGVMANHTDLAGRVDVANGRRFINGVQSANTADDNGHGTWVAGIAAASAGNRAYGAGVAPSATILPVKVMDANGEGDDADLANGIHWAVDHGADVINMSLGGAASSAVLENEIVYAQSHGVVVVAAAGNENDGKVEYPAAFPGVIAVTAVDRNSRKAFFSSWGADADIAAPGVAIMSTANDGSAGYGDGTSGASPFVAGAAALLRSAHPTSTPLEVAAALENHANDLGVPGWDGWYGSGELSLSALPADISLPGGDAWESDDSTSQAPVIEVGRPTDHALSPAGDTDFVAFDAVAGGHYDISTEGLWGGADTYLTLSDGAGSVVATDDNGGGGLAAKISGWTAPATGRYFAEVSDPNSHGGGYTLRIRQTAGPDQWEALGDNTPVNPPAFPVGSEQRRTFHAIGDPDYVSFDVQAGHTYEIVTTDFNANPLAPTVNTQSWLYRQTSPGVFGGSPVASDTNTTGPFPGLTWDLLFGGHQGSRIVWNAPLTETLALRVANGLQNPGTYALAIYEQDPPSVATRVAGSDRYSTASRIAASTFPGWSGVTDVIVACGEPAALADPISAAPLAGAMRSPILLTRPLALPSATRGTLQQIVAANGGVNIHVIGGTGSVSPYIYSQLSALRGTGTIERIGAADRYKLSALIARRTEQILNARGETAPAVLIGAGDNVSAFFDTLAASPAAYRSTVPILLVRKSLVPGAVTSALDGPFSAKKRYVLNGTGYVSGTVYSKVHASDRASNAMNSFTGSNWTGRGTNRYTMAESISLFCLMHEWSNREDVGLANVNADALSGSVLLGERGASLLYTPSSGLDDSTLDYLLNIYTFSYWPRNTWVLGGPGSIDTNAVSVITLVLNWDYSPR